MRFQHLKAQWRYLIPGVIVTVLLLLCACSSASSGTAPTSKRMQPSSNNATEATQSLNLLVPHVLTVGSYTNYPPQEYIDTATAQPAGFDIDLITDIARSLNLRVNIISEDFQMLVDGLLNRQFDVVISALSITPELQQKVNFIPYLQGGEALLVAKGNPQDIQDLADLCGKTVGVKATTFEQSDLQAASNTCKSTGKAVITIVVSQQNAGVLQLLATKRVVAIYQDLAVADYFVKQHPGQFQRAGSTVDANQEGIAVRKDNTALFDAIKRAFAASESNGTYRTLINKWGLVNGAIIRITSIDTGDEVRLRALA